MQLPPFLAFNPVWLRRQHNGWTPELQRRFILSLARGAGPDEAARSLGRTRQTAYRLRGKPGGESFAAAWDRAQDFARRAAAAGAGPAGHIGIDTLLVPRFRRGRLIGFVQREDVSGLVRALRHLDKLADAGSDRDAGPSRQACRHGPEVTEATHCAR
jgi:hypothetical protein